MTSKLKSRKLWVAVGGLASILLAEFLGVQVSAEALGAIAFLGASYIFGQGIVDKEVGKAQVKVAGDTGRLQIELYAKNLEAQLESVMNISPGAVDLTVVPE